VANDPERTMSWNFEYMKNCQLVLRKKNNSKTQALKIELRRIKTPSNSAVLYEYIAGYNIRIPATVAARSNNKTSTRFARSDPGSWVPIPIKAWMFGVCMRLFCVCVLLCLGEPCVLLMALQAASQPPPPNFLFISLEVLLF
jgi:hypothetical protein